MLHDGGFYFQTGSGGALRKIGSGKLTLSGTNTYTGATTVVGGTLTIASTGSIAGGAEVQGGESIVDGFIAGDVTVRANAILRGRGIIGGKLTVDSGGAVEIEAGNLTLTGGAVNNGRFTLKKGAGLGGSSSAFTNNGVLDLITSPGFVLPINFANNGTILDSSAAKVKAFERVGTNTILTIDSYSGHTFQLQSASALSAGAFTDLGAPQSGLTGTVMTFSIPATAESQRFFRVALDSQNGDREKPDRSSKDGYLRGTESRDGIDAALSGQILPRAATRIVESR